LLSIGGWAFEVCAELASVTSLSATPPTLGANVFYGLPANPTLYVSQGTKAVYQGADIQWNAFNIVDLVPVASVTLNKTASQLTVGAVETLTATVLPTDATDKSITWSSSDPTVASVNDNGEVTALKVGTTTITAAAHNSVKAECVVTVTNITDVPEHLSREMNVYPNPFIGELRITVAEMWLAASLRVINAAGAVVHAQILSNPDETINLEHLPSGFYIVRLEKDGQVKTVSVVKR